MLHGHGTVSAELATVGFGYLGTHCSASTMGRTHMCMLSNLMRIHLGSAMPPPIVKGVSGREARNCLYVSPSWHVGQFALRAPLYVRQLVMCSPSTGHFGSSVFPESTLPLLWIFCSPVQELSSHETGPRGPRMNQLCPTRPTLC